MKKRVFLFSVAALCAVSVNAQVQDSLQNHNLEEVVVRATKAAEGTPMAFSDVDKNVLEKNNFGQDVPYMISSTPSVIVTSDAGTGIGYTSFRVRGTGDNRINITVNGVPLNDSESQGVFWVNMPDFSSSLEQVQIQRGVGTSTNGAAAFGASISMQTQKPSNEAYLEVNSAVGSFDTYKNTFKGGTGLLKEHFVFDARYSLIRSNGYIDRAKADVSSYYASATYYGASTMVRFMTFGSAECTNQAWNYVPSSYIKAGNRTYNSCGKYEENGVTKYYDQTDNYWQHHYHLSAVQRLSDHLNMNITLHYTKGKGYYEDYKTDASFKKYALTGFNDSEGNEITSSDLVRRKWLNNDFYGFVYNMTYSTTDLNAVFGAAVNNYEGEHYGRVIWIRNYMNLNPKHQYYLGDGDKFDYNAFVKGTYIFFNGFSGYADLQYRGIDYKMTGDDDKVKDMDIHESFNFFNPKVGITYANGAHTSYASYAVGHREPNRNNYTESSVEHPTYETLYDYELGYTYAAKKWNVGVNLYYMDYDNQLIQTGKISEIGEALTSNVKDSYRMGIEFSAAACLCSCLNWNGNITLSENKIRHYTEYVSVYDEYWNEKTPETISYNKTDIAYSPSITANSTFLFNMKGISAAFNTVYVGKQYMDNTANKGRSIDAYFVNNLVLGYTFKPKFMNELALSCRINNLFNEEYESYGWVASYIIEGTSTLDHRTVEDGLATQAGTNAMVSLSLKF